MTLMSYQTFNKKRGGFRNTSLSPRQVMTKYKFTPLIDQPENEMYQYINKEVGYIIPEGSIKKSIQAYLNHYEKEAGIKIYYAVYRRYEYRAMGYVTYEVYIKCEDWFLVNI